MWDFPRKADGRRIFSVEVKRETVGRITSGERTLAELSRELEIAPAVIRNWMRLVERGLAHERLPGLTRRIGRTKTDGECGGGPNGAQLTWSRETPAPLGAAASGDSGGHTAPCSKKPAVSGHGE